MNIKELLIKLKSNPEKIDFDDVIVAIDNEYAFTPSQFVNGELKNQVGENSGS